MQKAQAQALTQGASSPSQTPMGVQTQGNQGQGGVSPTSTGQHPFAMSNPSALAYAAQQMGLPQMNMNMGMGMGMQMNPMLQMQMNLSQMSNMGAFANPHAMQSVMRHPSPGPMGGQNYMSMGGMPGF